MSRAGGGANKSGGSAETPAVGLIDTIGGRAGVALLTRDDYRQHPLLATR
jgi:hypothetical protein